MKAAALVALSAALLLCGCTITPQAADDDGKPVAREYEDESSAAPVIEPVIIEKDETVYEFGGPLVYEDFIVGDYDFIEDKVNTDQALFEYSYWTSYDDDDEWYRSLDFFPRMLGEETRYLVSWEYGAEPLDYDPEKDNILLWVRVGGNYRYELNAMHCTSYCDMIYPLPDLAEPFGQYAGLRFYFDDYDDIVMAVMYVNDDLMPLAQLDHDNFEYRSNSENAEPYSPESETLIPRVMLKGMESYEKLHTDMAYPCLRFEDGMVTVNWYDHDGNPAEGEGTLKDGMRLSYTMSENGIDFDLPEGGDNMATYISYNSYLDAYELHDPYWRDNYNCTLLLGRSMQQKDGNR